MKYLLVYCFSILSIQIHAQTALYPNTLSYENSILPPIKTWHGKSESFIASSDNTWITPTESSNFTTTPTHKETLQWLKELADASPLLHMISIGKSVENRDIAMIIASSENDITAQALQSSSKPLLLVQAGIHAGEIDGKDAGMMLLRDIAFGSKKYLLDEVNFLFIPILNVDGHERISPYNRPNQRGPENMGWRTNAQNLNLNRDYAKIDTKELRAVLNVINEYKPILYMDIHVTDGADYQHDITFGGFGKQCYSPNISHWLENMYKPLADADLVSNGHVPGPLLFPMNDRDFSEGNATFKGEPRFSNSYGDVRHLATILVENHSLKPFKQRVLGTYVLLESTLKILALHGKSLEKNTSQDETKKENKIPLVWKLSQSKPDSMLLLGISNQLTKSTITNSFYVQWTGDTIHQTIAHYKEIEPTDWADRPKAYWIPAACSEIITRLKLHGIEMETIDEVSEVKVDMYRMSDLKYQSGGDKPKPFEGHIQVNAKSTIEKRTEIFAPGSVRIKTNQPLGELASILLEPNSPDSYFQWGFFMEMFQRTEYIEAYVMEPTMQKMLDDSPELKREFEEKKKQDEGFAKDPGAIFSWFYSQTKYYDQRYLLYPVGKEM
ncbi:MAG: M14 family metallopeptidase [Bacteroidetes bacterium]|nr:M14 family metallopeptidase [Bacteroidota bacterium]